MSTKATQILQELSAGNERFRTGKSIHPRQSSERRVALKNGQNPLAAVLCCSDSRTTPELIFDQGLGDLFVVRVAGNIIDDHALASIEYAVSELGVGLIVVLGHQFCGAVSAACAGEKLAGHLPSLVRALRLPVENARKKTGDLVENAILENVRFVAEKMMQDGFGFDEKIRKNELTIAPAYYRMDNGAVEFL